MVDATTVNTSYLQKTVQYTLFVASMHVLLDMAICQSVAYAGKGWENNRMISDLTIGRGAALHFQCFLIC